MPLPVTPTDATRRRLLLAKALYSDALSDLLAPQRSHRRIIGVVALDLANETLLKAVVWDLAEGRQPKRDYAGLLAQARAALAVAAGQSGGDAPPLPAEGGATEVHDVRNDAQHRARSPSPEVLGACQVHTRDFMVAVTARVWDVDFDGLADSEAVEEPKCRSLLAEAESLLRDEAHLPAVRAAMKALFRASRLAADDNRFPTWSKYQFSDSSGAAPLAAFSRDVEDEFQTVRSAIRSLELGLDRASQTRLSRLGGYYSEMLNGVERWRDPQEPANPAAAAWAVTYCIEAVVRIEDRFGPLVSPYDEAPTSAPAVVRDTL